MEKENSSNSITFQQLVDAIKNLQPDERSRLLQILSKDELSIVNESEAIYTKSEPKQFDFEENWNNGLTSAEFIEKVHQHIDKLPWK